MLPSLTLTGLSLTCGRMPAPESTAARAKREQSALVERQRRAAKFAAIQPPASVRAAPAGGAQARAAAPQPAWVRALSWDLRYLCRVNSWSRVWGALLRHRQPRRCRPGVMPSPGVMYIIQGHQQDLCHCRSRCSEPGRKIVLQQVPSACHCIFTRQVGKALTGHAPVRCWCRAVGRRQGRPCSHGRIPCGVQGRPGAQSALQQEFQRLQLHTPLSRWFDDFRLYHNVVLVQGGGDAAPVSPTGVGPMALRARVFLEPESAAAPAPAVWSGPAPTLTAGEAAQKRRAEAEQRRHAMRCCLPGCCHQGSANRFMARVVTPSRLLCAHGTCKSTPGAAGQALTSRVGPPCARREQCLTESTAAELGPPDLGKFYALPRAELPEAFPHFEEDSFEDMLPRGGCRGLQAGSPGRLFLPVYGILCFPLSATKPDRRHAAAWRLLRPTATEPCREPPLPLTVCFPAR